MTVTVSAAEVEAALVLLQHYDAKTALAAFRSQDTLSKIVQGEIAVDTVAKIIGLGLPPVAIFASDLGILIEAEQVAIPLGEILIPILVKWFATLPLVQLLARLPRLTLFSRPSPSGSFQAFGHEFTGTLFQGTRK